MEKVYKFLNESYTALNIYKQNIEERINVCIGNVSCDMDSAIGAILLAYYLTYKDEYYNNYGNYEKFWIPVINCPRAEMCARIDISYHLKKFGVDADKLVYIDDLNLNFYSERNLLQLSLIDHNKLDMTQQQWDSAVVFLVDHHVDLKEYPNAEKILTFCGSACSLAMNLIFDKSLDSQILNKEICLFFWAAILLDTENFKPSLKGSKWSRVDELAFARAGRIIMQEQYVTLFEKKFDRRLNIELGMDLILKKDYKNYEWKNCVAGISVIFNPLHEFLSTFGVNEIKNTLIDRMKTLGLNIYCIISQVYLDNGIALREIMIYDNDSERLLKISNLFESLIKFSWQKKKFTGLTKNFSFYLFKDESVSRKKIEPIFKQILESI